MNTYTTNFFSQCPTNGIRIEYLLKIRTNAVIFVEDILNVLASLKEDYHENIADVLFERFEGSQTLQANHHGVTITTERQK